MFFISMIIALISGQENYYTLRGGSIIQNDENWVATIHLQDFEWENKKPMTYDEKLMTQPSVHLADGRLLHMSLDDVM